MNAEPASPLRALVLVIGLDLLLGFWLKLHYPDGLTWFFLINTPTIGLAASFWGLLPKPQQETVSQRLAAVLMSRGVQSALLAAILTLLAGSFLVAGVNVTLLDQGTTTTLHVVPGTQAKTDSAAIAAAASFPLDRIHSPTYLVYPAWPGRPLWLYSPTHVLADDARLIFWRPVDLVYPTDFTPHARVAVVPTPNSLDSLRRLRPTLVLRLGDASEELARVTLGDSTVIVSLLSPGRLAKDDLDRWTVWLDSMPHTADTARLREFHDAMARRWRAYRWVRPSRPLRQGDTVAWELRSPADTILQQGRLSLDAPTADLHLAF